MEHLTSKDNHRLLTFLTELYHLRTQAEFVSHLVAAVPQLIATDASGYNEINSRRQMAVYSGWPPDHPHFPDAQEILSRYAHQSPLIAYAERSKDTTAHKITDFVSQRAFRTTALFNEYYRPLQLHYNMGVRLTTAADPLICIGLLRSRRDFSTRDLALLTILSPHLMQAYHNAAAVTRLQDRMAAGENELMIRRQGFASVTEDGHIRFATPSAERLMTRYDAEAKRDRGSLPLSLRRWFLQELHRHASECLLQQPSRPFHIKRDDGVLLVRLLRHTPNTVLLFEESASPRAGHLRETFRLSDREAQVLEWVIQGKTNPEIGTILSISHRTVQKHLERIYTHLGVENRHAAISLVLSLRSSPEESHPPWNI